MDAADASQIDHKLIMGKENRDLMELNETHLASKMKVLSQFKTIAKIKQMETGRRDIIPNHNSKRNSRFNKK